MTRTALPPVQPDTPPTRRAALRHMAAAMMALAVGAAVLPAPLAAHPLPGAVIVISPEPARLSLTVTLPYADLALAMAGTVPKTLDAGPIPEDVEQALAAYFAQHMVVAADGQPGLTLTLTRAYLERATHEDLGAYTLLVLDFSAPVAAGSPVFPLTLRYDAVMHEVRNHRATVWLQPAGQDPVAIGEIRLDAATGKATPLVIPIAP
jgi:hypothetical protein